MNKNQKSFLLKYKKLCREHGLQLKAECIVIDPRRPIVNLKLKQLNKKEELGLIYFPKESGINLDSFSEEYLCDEEKVRQS